MSTTVVWKFALSSSGTNIVHVPKKHSLCLVDIDPATGNPAVWVELDPSQALSPHSLNVYGTGWAIPKGDQWVGSCVDRKNGLVWHVFAAP